MSKNAKEEFYNITMTGKICYIFMCIERYLVDKYPDRDWTPVAKHMWQWTEHWWLSIGATILYETSLRLVKKGYIALLVYKNTTLTQYIFANTQNILR